MEFQPSSYQQGVFGWIQNGSGHAVVNAVAGSGKSTTLVEGAKLLPADKKAVFIAFNNHVVSVLKSRLKGTTMVARTIHSIGYQALHRELRGCRDPYQAKYRRISRQLIEANFRRADRYEVASYSASLADLCDLARFTLVPIHRDEIHGLSIRHGVRIDRKPVIREKIFSLVTYALREGERAARDQKTVDYADMIYLPYKWGLDLAPVDWVFADEIQDFNRAQMELVLRLIKPETGRFLGVGDPHQSIMGFAGADDQSFQKIQERLEAVELPLSICYRCPRSHVSKAQEIVPQIEPHESAPEGEIVYASSPDLLAVVQSGDLIICRKTAPVVSWCIKLIEAGKAARVRGREVGRSLTSIVRLVAEREGFSMGAFINHLNLYESERVNALDDDDGSDAQIESIIDKVAAVRASFMRFQSPDPETLCKRIDDLFSDDESAIWLSTIHRAKGLEADRVIVLEYDNLPLTWEQQKEWQLAQEWNLLYVALTRAKQTLILMGAEPKKSEPRQLSLFGEASS